MLFSGNNNIPQPSKNLKFDMYGVPTRDSLMQDERITKNYLVRDRIATLRTIKFLKFILETFSVIGTSVGIGAWFQTFTLLGLSQQELYILGSILGAMAGLAIARNQQKAFNTIGDSIKAGFAKFSKSVLIYVLIAGTDLVIMANGTIVIHDFLTEAKWHKVNDQAIDLRIADAIEKRDELKTQISILKADRASLGVFVSSPSDLKFLRDEMISKLSKDWDTKREKQIKKIRRKWRSGATSIKNKYFSSSEEIKGTWKSFNRAKTNALNQARIKLKNADAKLARLQKKDIAKNKAESDAIGVRIKKLQTEVDAIVIPTKEAPTKPLDWKILYGGLFLFSLLLALMDDWKARVMKLRESDLKGKVTSLRNEYIKDAGFNPETYEKDYIEKLEADRKRKENEIKEMREHEERMKNKPLELEREREERLHEERMKEIEAEREREEKQRLHEERLKEIEAEKEREEKDARLKEVALKIESEERMKAIEAEAKKEEEDRKLKTKALEIEAKKVEDERNFKLKIEEMNRLQEPIKEEVEIINPTVQEEVEIIKPTVQEEVEIVKPTVQKRVGTVDDRTMLALIYKHCEDDRVMGIHKFSKIEGIGVRLIKKFYKLNPLYFTIIKGKRYITEEFKNALDDD
jgi:hypothetical protein